MPLDKMNIVLELDNLRRNMSLVELAQRVSSFSTLEQIFKLDCIEDILSYATAFNSTYPDALIDCFIDYAPLTPEICEKYDCKEKELQTETVVCYIDGKVYTMVRHVKHDRLPYPIMSTESGLIYHVEDTIVRDGVFIKDKHFATNYPFLCPLETAPLDNIHNLLLTSPLNSHLINSLSLSPKVSHNLRLGHPEITYVNINGTDTLIVKWNARPSPIDSSVKLSSYRLTYISDRKSVIDKHCLIGFSPSPWK